MISRLVQSAFQTGWLSVESESLIRQVLSIKAYQKRDLEALEELYQAVYAGQVRRESRSAMPVEYNKTLAAVGVATW